MGLLHHQFTVLWQLKTVWRNNFSGPGTSILKVNFLCINGTRKPLLIHGFSPVNARLLTVYGTAFYAITLIESLSALILEVTSHEVNGYPSKGDNWSVIKGWMTRDFLSCSAVLKSCQDDGREIMKRCLQWNPVYEWKDIQLRQGSNPGPLDQ